jgi:hypothetical protein
MFKELLKLQSPKKEATETLEADSSESLDHTLNRSDTEKEEDDYSEENSQSSPTFRTRPASGENVLKKQANSVDTSSSRPGTNKVRPIPEMPEITDSVPRDPDKDLPNIPVSNN